MHRVATIPGACSGNVTLRNLALEHGTRGRAILLLAVDLDTYNKLKSAGVLQESAVDEQVATSYKHMRVL